MQPISELEGFNAERILVEYEHGFETTGYYKDGLIQLDGNPQWKQPNEFKRFMRLSDLDKFEAEKNDHEEIENFLYYGEFSKNKSVKSKNKGRLDLALIMMFKHLENHTYFDVEEVKKSLFTRISELSNLP